MAETQAKAKAKTIKLGDIWELPKGANMVTTPDGTTVTARGTFTPRAKGKHVATGAALEKGAKPVSAEINVTA